MKTGNLTAATALGDDTRYLALKARDARFDGCFFTGVTSTGIYCRPVCRVKTPKRENCRFFALAAQAEKAGFRPCLRCRPELAPHSVAWSIQDASAILAHQAARLLDEHVLAPSPCTSGSSSVPIMSALAARMGISERHVRRIFEAQFGVSPLQYLQTQRLHTAKQLLADTALPITQVALASGFASVRRFNSAFVTHYRLNPTQLRRQGACDNVPRAPGITVRLGYRPPYDAAAMLEFHRTRALDTLEMTRVDAGRLCFCRTFGIVSGGKLHAGWLSAHFDSLHPQLILQVSESLGGVLPLVIRRIRNLFDLDADPAAINSALHASFPDGDGLRVPGTLDGFELAVRAVLGQQVTVAAGRTLAQRLVNRFGAAVDTPWPQLTRLFPAPAVLAAAAGDGLGQLGIVRQRQAAIAALARAVASGELQLHSGVDVQQTVSALKALPGIGDWTAQYIALRALRWPDAFPAGDVALQRALGMQGLAHPERLTEAASQVWKPWRSYAVIRAWSSPVDAQPGKAMSAPASRRRSGAEASHPTHRAGNPL